jgi:hypothetical protein
MLCVLLLLERRSELGTDQLVLHLLMTRTRWPHDHDIDVCVHEVVHRNTWYRLDQGGCN